MRKSTFMFLLATFFCLSFTTVDKHPNKKHTQVTPTLVVPPVPSVGTFLFCATITQGAGSTPDHINEVAVESEQAGMTLPFSRGGGGVAQTGTPNISDFAINKSFDISTFKIQKALLSGQSNDFEIRYYNGIAPAAVYVIKLKDAIITSYSESSSDCSGGCPFLNENITFAPILISWTYSNGGTPITLTYNIATGQAS